MTIYLDMVPNKKASILRYKYRQHFNCYAQSYRCNEFQEANINELSKLPAMR